jgi:hypothetical protein
MLRWSLAAAFLVAGCGNNSPPPMESPYDFAGFDLASFGPTGAPCKKDSDCSGTSPRCIMADTRGITWPGGYCSSACNPMENDSGLNLGCPGGSGTCVGTGTQGICESLCTNKIGSIPCTRSGYSCFVGCEPDEVSQCDPRMAAGMPGSCPQDGGVFLYDGGYSGRVCVRVGSDDVGQCADGCDPFRQDCLPIVGMTAACYASDDTGEGICSPEVGKGQGDGKACSYLNACDPGFACFAVDVHSAPVCRPYCGGPGSLACTNGKKCVDLSPLVKAATIGVCGG